MSTLEQELLQAADETVCFCEATLEEALQVCQQCKFAARLRQRAAWVRERGSGVAAGCYGRAGKGAVPRAHRPHPRCCARHDREERAMSDEEHLSHSGRPLALPFHGRAAHGQRAGRRDERRGH